MFRSATSNVAVLIVVVVPETVRLPESVRSVADKAPENVPGSHELEGDTAMQLDGPSAAPSESVALAAWFAATFEAGEMIVIGAELPACPQVPLRAVDVEQKQL